MKSKLVLMLLVVATLFGCDVEDGKEHKDNMIWDVMPININISVQNRDGEDLLSPLCKDNILQDSIYVSYDGLKFPLGEDMSSQTMSRAYLAVLSGLSLSKYGNDYILIFGEFDGAKDWNDSFVINWGDGSYDTISFTRDFEWGSDGAPKITNSALYLNNKKVEEELVIIR